MDDTRKAVLASTTAIVVGLGAETLRTPGGLEEAIRITFKTLNSLVDDTPKEPTSSATEADYSPAVTVRKSLASPDHIISMIDGKPYKTLRRHLSTHGLTPESYRQRYGLKADYPMVAENYSNSRRKMALAIGLGRKPGQKPA